MTSEDKTRVVSTERIDVKTGFNCNNRCLFCVQGDKRNIHGNKSTEEVKEVLRNGIKDTDAIVFTGGEVTMRKDFLELVAYAKELGFKLIQIQTNGRMLAYRKFCEETIAAGANEFSPALHGHTAELHDYLTQVKGSYKQTLQSIINLKELGQRVITNSVITRSNFRHLPDLARIFTRVKVDQFQFAFVHALGTAAQFGPRIVPRFTMIEPYIKRAIQIGEKAGSIVLTEAIPYCFMRGFEMNVAERFIPRTKIYDANFVVADYTNFRWTEGKAKAPICAECTWNPVCEGPWKDYPDIFGWDEFVPRKDPITIELPEERRS